MKSFYVFTVLFAVIACSQADNDSEKYAKQAIENIDQLLKKFHEVTGIQTDFDKTKVEKLYKDNFGKVVEKWQELYKSIEKDAKPFNDEVKKNIESIVKQFNETIKNINTPELQGKVKNVQEALQNSFKKVSEQLTELAKATGVAPPPAIQKHLDEINQEISKSAQKLADKFQQLVAESQKELGKKKPSA